MRFCGIPAAIRAGDLRAALRPDTALVSVMHANNEAGTIQPIAEIAALACANGSLMHTDAAQSAGKLALDVDGLGVDQEHGLRPGTENVAQIVGAGETARLARSRLPHAMRHLATLRDDLHRRLAEGAMAPRLAIADV